MACLRYRLWVLRMLQYCFFNLHIVFYCAVTWMNNQLDLIKSATKNPGNQSLWSTVCGRFRFKMFGTRSPAHKNPITPKQQTDHTYFWCYIRTLLSFVKITHYPSNCDSGEENGLTKEKLDNCVSFQGWTSCRGSQSQPSEVHSKTLTVNTAAIKGLSGQTRHQVEVMAPLALKPMHGF